MTTVELAQYIIRNTSVEDLSAASPEDAMEVLRAINAGIQRFYSAAPSKWNRTTASFLIKEPETTTAAVTDQSVSVSNTPFTAAQRGCSVLINGDPTYNEIVATNQLLNPYLGTTGSQSATVYWDALTITDFKVERITSDPWVKQTGRRLVRAEQFDSDSYVSRFNSWGRNGSRALGSYPETYRVDYVGMSDAQSSGDAVVILRLDPIPTTECVLNIDIDVRPGTYALSTLETPSTIPVHDSMAFDTIVPLCEGELVLSPIWSRPDIAQGILNRAQRAETDVMNLNREFAKAKRRTVNKRGW